MTERVAERYLDQRSRGTQGFGYYIPALNRLTHNPNEDKLILNLLNQDASEVLFHHRMPTSTANVQNACHPFSTKGPKDLFKHNYVMVHNGYLSNDNELKEAHYKLGITYVSMQPDGCFNDSEALLYDLALYKEGHQTELKARGAIAFVMIERDEKGEAIHLHYGRNTSPLKFTHKRGKYLTLASEGKGSDVSPDTWNTFDYATSTITQTDVKIPGYEYASQSYTTKWTYEDDDYTGFQDYEWSYFDHNGDHYYGNTSPNIPDRFCHYQGMPCPKGISYAWKPLHERRQDRINSQTNLALYRADYDTEAAIDDIELAMVSNKNEYLKLKASLAVYDEDQQANEFLNIAAEMEKLDEQDKVYRGVLTHLDQLYDTEAEEAALETQLLDVIAKG